MLQWGGRRRDRYDPDSFIKDIQRIFMYSASGEGGVCGRGDFIFEV